MAKAMTRKNTNTVKVDNTVNNNENTSAVTTETPTETITETPVQREVPKLTAASYKPDDLILCRSMFAGKLLFTGIKTKMTYEFSNIGDVQYIEYQDLRAAMVTGVISLTAPYIIVEDEVLLEDPHWKKISDLYNQLYSSEDVEKILNLPAPQFKEAFFNLPIGFKKTINTLVATRIEEGTFDSMNKVRIIDDICGTDLRLLLS